jgi:hypothetical protein
MYTRVKNLSPCPYSGVETLILVVFSAVFIGSGCMQNISTERTYTPTEIYAEQNPAPTPPSTLDELIRSLSSDNAEVRIVAMRALSQMGAEAAPAVPLLIDNLGYDNSEIRRVAVLTLGEIGLEAASAIPELLAMLSSDPSINVRRAIPSALGSIGKETVIPDLAEALYSDDPIIAMKSAEAIEALSNEDFGGPQLNSEGVPTIIAEAREWWEEEGQFLDWSDQ